MSLVVATMATTTASQANLIMQLAMRREAKLRRDLAAAIEAREAAGKRILSDTTGQRKRLRQQEESSPSSTGRTSTLAFASKNPAAALAALDCVDLSAATRHTFPDLKTHVYKYNVRSTSETLVAKSIYPSTKASAMEAAKTTRYVFDSAVELANANGETYAKARDEISWHSPQQMVKGRETRGCGIVMYSEAALTLVKEGLAAAKERTARRVEEATLYTRQMTATAAAVSVEERAIGESFPSPEVERASTRIDEIGAAEDVTADHDVSHTADA